MWAIPFGFAVVPDVYMRKRRSSASIGSGGQLAGSSETSRSCSQVSRPDCIGTVLPELPSFPVRRTTRQRLIPGASAIAASAVRLSGTVEPRRQASSCVISTSQPMSFARSESESAEKPPKTTVCGAPSRVQASIATGSSGIIPM